MTRAGNVFVPRDLDLRPLDSKINGLPGIMVNDVSVDYGDPSDIVFYRATLR